MARKRKGAEEAEIESETNTEETQECRTAGADAGDQDVTICNILSCKEDVAKKLGMSVQTLNLLVNEYPFEDIGIPAKIRGRWRVTELDVHRWFRYVQYKETEKKRHPEARRMRPAEPPDIEDIQGR